MKRFSILLFALAIGLSSYAQVGAGNFMFAIKPDWGKFEYCTISNVSLSAPSSNIIHMNQGGPGVLIDFQAFTPNNTLGFIKLTATVYKCGTNKPIRSARIQVNNIYFFNYPVEYAGYRYFLYPVSNWASCGEIGQQGER